MIGYRRQKNMRSEMEGWKRGGSGVWRKEEEIKVKGKG